MPGNGTALRISSPLPSLVEQAAVDVAVSFRSCRENEYVDAGACAVCARGSFLDVDGTCVECRTGLDCDEPGNDLVHLSTEAGYYRVATTSRRAYACFVDAACPYGEAVGGDACRAGHQGHTCSSCVANHYLTVDGVCRRCTVAVNIGVQAAYFAILIIIATVICWLICSDRGTRLCMSLVDAHAGSGANDAVSLVQKTRKENESFRDRDEEYIDKKQVIVFVKIRAVLTFAQLASTMPAVLGTLNFPSAYLSVLKVASLANLSFLNFLPSRCLTSISARAYYVRSLVVTTASPILFMAFLAIVYKSKTTLHGTMVRRKRLFYTEFFLLVTHVVLSVTSITSFQAFVCDEFDAGDQGTVKVLRVERTLSCESQLWHHTAVYAGFMVAIYPVGVPLLYAVLLFAHHEKLNPTQHTQPLLNVARASVRRLMHTSFKRLVDNSTAHQLKVSKTRQSKINDGLFREHPRLSLPLGRLPAEFLRLGARSSALDASSSAPSSPSSCPAPRVSA